MDVGPQLFLDAVKNDALDSLTKESMAAEIYWRLAHSDYRPDDLEKIAEAARDKRKTPWSSYCRHLDKVIRESPQNENWKRFKTISSYSGMYLEAEEWLALAREHDSLAREILREIDGKIHPGEVLPACKTEYPREGTVYNKTRTCRYFNDRLFNALSECQHNPYSGWCDVARDILDKVGCDGGYIGLVREVRAWKGSPEIYEINP